MRTGAALLLLMAAGCACEADARSHDAGRPPPSAPAPLDAQQRVVRDWLRTQAISETHFGAPVLYAWVDDEDLGALRAGGSIGTLPSSADVSLDLAMEGDASEIAAHLREPARSGRRRAWPSPWASRLGWPGREPAGDHLVRVELRPESVLVLYDARTAPPSVRFATERGVSAPFAEASQVPDLWAAVLLIHEVSEHDGSRALSREYVLVSPEMIGRVSTGSPEITNELRTERTRITRLAQMLGDLHAALTPGVLRRAWAAVPDDDATFRDVYASAITSGARYPLEPATLMRLAGQLADDTEPYEWRTALPSEPRPRFFDE